MLGRISKTLVFTLLLTLMAAAQTLPSGSKVTIRLGSAISSASATTGQTFRASLVRSLTANGKTFANAGAPAVVKVTHSKSSGRLHDPGELTVRLISIDGVPVSTTAHSFKGKSHTKGNVMKIGGGAAAGALIGGLVGGGKGALIGTAAGGAAGTGAAAATGKEEAKVPAEAALTFTTTKAISRR
jgi:hypothetical protein